ncbi:unnamed protein product [Urochloa humidicola]
MHQYSPSVVDTKTHLLILVTAVNPCHASIVAQINKTNHLALTRRSKNYLTLPLNSGRPASWLATGRPPPWAPSRSSSSSWCRSSGCSTRRARRSRRPPPAATVRGDEEAGGGGEEGQQQLPAEQAAGPPLVCTYRRADGWRERSCGVCLSELADGELVRVLPACMHYFHAACVGEWLSVHATCPLCRAPLAGTATDTT